MSKSRTQAAWGSIILQVMIALCLVLTIWVCRSGEDQVREDILHNAKGWALINKLAAKTNTVSEIEDWKKLASALVHYGINETKAQEYDARAHGHYLHGIGKLALAALSVMFISICLSSFSLIRVKKARIE